MQDNRDNSGGGFQFEGFSSPNGTIVPDDFFDVLAPELSEAELRVCLYIIRRTFGFKKESDDISLRQMVDGIRTKDGRVLDYGAGVVKSSAAKAIKGLVDKGVVVALRNSSRERGDEPTTYMLRFKDRNPGTEDAATQGVSAKRTRGVRQTDRGVSAKRTHNKQFLQETESSKRERPSRLRASIAETAHLDQVITEFSQALGDEAHIASNRVQARNLLVVSGMTEQRFVGRMYEAFSVTKDRARDGDVANKAPYFFAVLRDLIALTPMPSRNVVVSGTPAAPAPMRASHERPRASSEPESTTVRPIQAIASVAARAIPGTSLTTTEAWNQVLLLLEGNISKAALRAYFAHTQLREVRDGKAVVVAANAFVAGELQQRFRPSIAAVLSRVIGSAIAVSVEPPSSAKPTSTPDSSPGGHHHQVQSGEPIRTRDERSKRMQQEPATAARSQP